MFSLYRNGIYLTDIQSYTEIEITSKFYESDLIELVIPINSPTGQTIKKNDILHYTFGGRTRAYLVVTIIPSSDGSYGIKGIQYGSFRWRVIYPPYNDRTHVITGPGVDDYYTLITLYEEFSGEIGDIMAYYVGRNCCSSGDIARRIPLLSTLLDSESETTKTDEYKGRLQTVEECLTYLGKRNDYGHETIFKNGQYYFHPYAGVDRTVTNDKAYFGEQFGNIANPIVVDGSFSDISVAITGDDESGGSRTFGIVGVVTGNERKEVFIDVDDKDALREAENIIEPTDVKITGDMIQTEFYKYGENFYLGDKIYVNALGYFQTKFITGSVETYNESGYNVTLETGDIGDIKTKFDINKKNWNVYTRR